MNDRITIDGVVYVRADSPKNDEIVFDDWQQSKVKAAWEAVEKAEVSARAEREQWERDNPSRIVCGMIRAFYERKYDRFDECAKMFVDWAERNKGHFDGYTTFIRDVVCGAGPDFIPMEGGKDAR